MTRIGRYVSGSASAEKTTEYSVTATGSTVVRRTATASTVDSRITAWNRAAWRGATNLPHRQPKNWAMLYPTESPVSHAAPNVAAKNPSNATTTPIFPTPSATG